MVLEVFVPGFVLACLGSGSLGGAVAAALNVSFEMQLVVSALTALMAFVFLRPFALKMGFSGSRLAESACGYVRCVVYLEFCCYQHFHATVRASCDT